MKSKFLHLCFIALAIVTFAQASWAAPSWTQLEKGLSYKMIKTSGVRSKPTITLHALLVDPKHFVLKPIYQSGQKNGLKLFESSGAIAAFNANFFDELSKPLGLVKKEGVILNPIKKISWWSLFCSKNQKNSIVPSLQAKDGQCDHAIEAGPRLVIDGTIPKLKDEFSRKTAVGIRSDGQIILVVSEGALPIKELAKIFWSPESEGGLTCKQALNLDGGSSSQMILKTEKFKKTVSSFVAVPVFLGVFPRD